MTDGLLGEEERLMKPLLSLLVLATDESSTAAGSDQHRALTIASHQCILIANDATSPIFFFERNATSPSLLGFASRSFQVRVASGGMRHFAFHVWWNGFGQADAGSARAPSSSEVQSSARPIM